MLTVALALILASVLLAGFLGWEFGVGHGRKVTEAEWELEWEARKGWLVPAAPLPDHGYAPPVHRRATDAFTHVSGTYQALPPVVDTMGPIRTEVLAGYRGRHSTDQPTGPIERPPALPPPGEITDLIQRILDEADRPVAS